MSFCIGFRRECALARRGVYACTHLRKMLINIRMDIRR